MHRRRWIEPSSPSLSCELATKNKAGRLAPDYASRKKKLQALRLDGLGGEIFQTTRKIASAWCRHCGADEVSRPLRLRRRATCRRRRNRLTVRSGRLRKGSRHRRVPTLAAGVCDRRIFQRCAARAVRAPSAATKSRFVNPKSKLSIFGNPISLL